MQHIKVREVKGIHKWERWQMQKKELLHQIKDKDRTNKLTKGKDRISNNKIKMQQDNNIYI